ncbi:hypothetical protein PC9H_010284 [Pleurotus ostreatus]|uniref:HNH nuclease domain-containing protein n=2 Tax=Pleurotus ostreatus TaxID=5322 RepID=A0A8H6ZNI0_PLEOS|nr:uncharacterized protein PC9H_010284 [Pleurotus ostreatus]KAF7424973.1 hypothetical protein PC9H_010284 [Pleurotus ostreatus]
MLSRRYIHDDKPSEDAKKLVGRVDPNSQRCLIENRQDLAVEHCYLLPTYLLRNERIVEMSSLEWFWGMKHGSLNLDTRYNVFPISSSLLRLYEENKWGLLPSDDIVHHYARGLSLGFASRPKGDTVQNGVFTYRFLPLSKAIESMGILHQHDHPTPHPPTPSSFITSVHPFSELQNLESHLHPKFAIAALGYKLGLVDQNRRKELLLHWPILWTLMSVHRAWMVSVPAVACDHESFASLSESRSTSDSGYGGGISEGTIPIRPRPRVSAKRERSASLDELSMSSQKRARLSAHALLCHDRRSDRSGWTRKRISDWAASSAYQCMCDTFGIEDRFDPPILVSTIHEPAKDPRIPPWVPSRGTKIRVDSVDPNQGRCLIENCLKFREVEYCHVIPRSFTKFTDNMTNLEWYWGLRHSTLDLDTRRNILLAGSSLHGLHDNHRWGLLPPDDIINKYANNIDEEEHYQRGSVEVPDGVFSYRLIPLHPGMETIGIHRQLGHEPDNLTFTTHVFPFDQLPPLQCHIHPKFAIYEFGSKLVGLAAEMRAELFERWPILDKIALIYRAWDAPPTEDISKWLMDIPDSKGDSSDDDEYPPQV